MDGIMNFYKFLQDWGVKLGKDLIKMMKNMDANEKSKYKEEDYYYHYDVACMTQNEFSENSTNFEK